MQLPGGAMALAFGGDYHYESFRDMVPDSNVNVPFDGRTPSDSHASRRVKSAFAEIDVPITKQLDVDLSLRADKYYDVGGTVNPKVSFRYQPLKTLMFRGSYNTGFHAPSLIESYGSTKGGIGNTKENYDDPLLCPGGTPGVAGTGHALPGYSPVVVCNAKQPHITGANPGLNPEKSKAMTFGLVVDPVKNLSIALDYWRIDVTDTIGTLSDALIFANPQRYAAYFMRDANNNLLYVNAQSHNLGDTIASGEDITVNYLIPAGDMGKFTVTMDGTYNNRYDYQTEPGGVWYHNVGAFGGLSNGAITGDKIMTYRWRHNLRLSWMRGPWRATLTQMYNSSYHDGTAVDPQYYRDIKSSEVYNLTAAYHGFKNVVINAGISNLTNEAPPLTNTISVGWLRSYASPVGRAYSLTATYNF
jgi:iron complex outermembrane receptor protein